MVKKKTKNFYALIRGEGEPMVSTWGVVGELVNGYPDAKHMGFVELNKAKDWMAANGQPTFHFYMSAGIERTQVFHGKKGVEYYAVARGRQVGIYGTWKEAQEQTNRYEGSLVKKFGTEEEAQLFIEENRLAEEAVQDSASKEEVTSSICEGIERLSIR